MISTSITLYTNHSLLTMTLALHSGPCLPFYSHQVPVSPLLVTLTTLATLGSLNQLSFLGALCLEFSSHLR